MPLVMNTQTTYRTVVFRLHPRSRRKHDLMTQTAGACRYVWNWALAENERQYREALQAEAHIPLDWTEAQIAELRALMKPVHPSFFSLGKEFTKLRRHTAWLSDAPFAPVRYTLKHQADAWSRFFKGKGGRPRFKGRLGDDSFTIPENVRLAGDSLFVPKTGWVTLSRKGGNPYADCRPLRATVKRSLGRWQCTICYAVEEHKADNGLILGVDMNVGQVAVSTGDILRMPDTSRLEARKNRYQRMMARRQKGSGRRARARHLRARTDRRIAAVRANWQHHVSRTLADTAGTVVVEALKTAAMTKSARGTAEAPGTNVKAKSGLNREIRKTGWSGLREKIEYKACTLLEVNPAHTSQRCSRCGHVSEASRRSQSEYGCVACGHEVNADVNAALNIVALGIGASGRREALELSTSPTRQHMNLRLVA